VCVCVRVCVCAHVCVCERERERERDKGLSNSPSKINALIQIYSVYTHYELCIVIDSGDTEETKQNTLQTIQNCFIYSFNDPTMVWMFVSYKDNGEICHSIAFLRGTNTIIKG
jgi:hypothetical protein